MYVFANRRQLYVCTCINQPPCSICVCRYSNVYSYSVPVDKSPPFASQVLWTAETVFLTDHVMVHVCDFEDACKSLCVRGYIIIYIPEAPSLPLYSAFLSYLLLSRFSLASSCYAYMMQSARTRPVCLRALAQ